MRNRTLLVSVALSATALLPLAGCSSQSLSDGGSTTAAPAGPDLSSVTFEDQTGSATAEVDAIDNAFEPQYVEVKAGTTVTFKNDGRNDHNVIPVRADEFTAIQADQFKPGTEATVTFAEAGDYPYYCSLHGNATKGMTGAIRVVP